MVHGLRFWHRRVGGAVALPVLAAAGVAVSSFVGTHGVPTVARSPHRGSLPCVANCATLMSFFSAARWRSLMVLGVWSPLRILPAMEMASVVLNWVFLSAA